MKKSTKLTARGVTLPEMLVAVSITAAMMLMTGIIFKAASEAAGKAMAHNDIMAQLRALTRQLDNDFKGLRPDMPMAIIFEGIDIDGDSIPDIRQDRISFYTNGDFQDINGSISGNLARIFYGQATDIHTISADPTSGDRYILTRRQKITSPLAFTPLDSFGTGPLNYDFTDDENSHREFWRTEATSSTNFQTVYFTEAADVSLIRRPNIININAAGVSVDDLAVQKLYLLPDVDEFKIEFWNNTTGQWDTNFGYAAYWGLPDLDIPPPGTPTPIGLINWWSEDDLQATSYPDPWPKALRFTFTLYDKNRRHYPDGFTFHYIVKLPKR